MNSPGSPTSSLIVAHSEPFRLNIVPKLQLHRTELLTCPSSPTAPHFDGRRSRRKGCWSALSQHGHTVPLAPLQAAAEARQEINETEVRPRTPRVQNNFTAPCLHIPCPALTPDAIRRCEVTTVMSNSRAQDPFREVVDPSSRSFQFRHVKLAAGPTVMTAPAGLLQRLSDDAQIDTVLIRKLDTAMQMRPSQISVLDCEKIFREHGSLH